MPGLCFSVYVCVMVNLFLSPIIADMALHRHKGGAAYVVVWCVRD